jgi:hypothetical protein
MKVKQQSSKFQTELLQFIADRNESNNIELLKHFKKNVSGYQSLQIEVVNSKLLKLENKGLIIRKNVINVSNDLTDNPNIVGTIAQISYMIDNSALDIYML